MVLYARTFRVNDLGRGGHIRTGREQNLSENRWAYELELIHCQLRHIREPKGIQEIWGRQTLHNFIKLVKQKIKNLLVYGNKLPSCRYSRQAEPMSFTSAFLSGFVSLSTDAGARREVMSCKKFSKFGVESELLSL